jgi:hypothetical protein
MTPQIPGQFFAINAESIYAILRVSRSMFSPARKPLLNISSAIYAKILYWGLWEKVYRGDYYEFSWKI